MRGLKSSMHALYRGSSWYFKAWQTSRNFLKALGHSLLQSCFADTFIFVLQTWNPLLGPCASLLSWNTCCHGTYMSCREQHMSHQASSLDSISEEQADG